MAWVVIKRVMSQEDFLEATNGKCRARLFSSHDYKEFVKNIRKADEAAFNYEPFYAEWDGGGVANSYGYAATTARCGIYTTPHGEVKEFVDRVPARKRGAACIFHGGEKAYLNWFEEQTKGDEYQKWLKEQGGER